MPTEFEEKKQHQASRERSQSGDSVSKYIPTPPDGGYGWVIVLCSFLNHILIDGITYTFGVFYLEFLDYFGDSKARTALVGSLLLGTYLLSGVIVGALTNRFGCRPVCMAGGALSSASFFLASFSTSLDMLMVTYGVMAGFGFGLVFLPSVVSISFYFEKRRAFAVGIGVCGSGVGCFIFAPVGKLLLTVFDWRNALRILAGLVLHTCVTGALMRPLTAPQSLRQPRKKTAVDRLMERIKNKLGIKRSDAIPLNAEDTAADVEKVHQMKLNRERLIQREDEDLECSSFNSVPKGLDSDGAPTDKAVNISNGERSVPPTLNGNMQNGHVELEGNETTKEKPIFNGPKGNESLMTFLLQKKLHDAEGNGNNVVKTKKNGPNRANYRMLESAPSLALDEMQLPENQIEQQGRCNSDMWNIKQKKNLSKKKQVDIPKEDYARPMYRKDIFYSGSIHSRPEFQSNPNVASYVQSMTSIPDRTVPEHQSKCGKVCCLPKVSKDVFQNMLDLSLLKDVPFWLVCMGNLFGMMGVYVPFVFLADRAVSLEIPDTKAAMLLSVVGLTNTLGRVAAGFLADLRCVNALLLHNLAVLVLGVACILNMFCTTYPLMCLFAAVFGISYATWISLTTVILCQLLGMDKLTNAFGLLSVLCGIGVVAGPPVAGIVYDTTENFDAVFHTGGGLIILASLFLLALHLPCIRSGPVDMAKPTEAIETEEKLLSSSTGETP